MVDSALNHLGANPYSEDTSTLIQNLFLKRGVDAQSNRDKMDKVEYILSRVNRYYRNEVAVGANPKFNDVVIYCDDSRFVDTGKKDRLRRTLYRDTTNNAISRYNMRSCHEGIGDFVTLAVTFDVTQRATLNDLDSGEFGEVNLNTPTQIQICPWFVDWDQEQRVQDRRPDAFALLDKVLLHEMTHGREAWNQAKRNPDGSESRRGTLDVSLPII
ncbi:hypothetical protein N0V90_012595 [Kalmusia sp. IMI 367209]|nr:hypothetical protein N0V90_012595 [Kalmusia sp. IMI 367209]